METHLYSLCWNEADMLGFFFRNYDTWVDRYIIFDDGSTDGSIEILRSHPKVELRRWHRKYPDSYLLSQADWMNSIWKESRGNSDWAVIVDIDEHLYTPKSPMQDLLEHYKSHGITLAPALGYQMLSEEFPNADEHLIKTRTRGTPWANMCKLSIFNPDAIVETNFSLGRHSAKPVGNLKYPRHDEHYLFHYKYLGLDRTLEKLNLQSTNLGKYDSNIMNNYGWSRKDLEKDWDKYLQDSCDLSSSDAHLWQYPQSGRWWRWMGIPSFFSQWFGRFKKFLNHPLFMIKRLGVYLAHYFHTKKLENRSFSGRK